MAEMNKTPGRLSANRNTVKKLTKRLSSDHGIEGTMPVVNIQLTIFNGPTTYITWVVQSEEEMHRLSQAGSDTTDRLPSAKKEGAEQAALSKDQRQNPQSKTTTIEDVERILTVTSNTATTLTTVQPLLSKIKPLLDILLN